MLHLKHRPDGGVFVKKLSAINDLEGVFYFQNSPCIGHHSA
jgi:hypothetical protein